MEQTKEHRWELQPERAPTVPEGMQIMYDEPGRIVMKPNPRHPGEGTDCRSHWFRLVKSDIGAEWWLLAHHGGGQQRVRLGYGYRNYPAMFDPLSSDARFWLMWQMLEIFNEARSLGAQEAGYLHKKAFVEGRLKKRKYRGSDEYKVWID